jgi:RHS repeat-associated protein
MRTRDAVTGRTVFTFGYDSVGRLTSVADADGNVTTLERNQAGTLAAVVSPFGQRTTVTPDARGYLASITNPAGDTISVQHDSLGLLTLLQDANDNPAQRFRYDSLGRLVKDSTGAGASYTLARTETDTSATVTLTSALGRTKTLARVTQRNGIVRRSETDHAGHTSNDEERPNGTSVMTAPSGTTFTMTRRADPRFGMEAPGLANLTVALPSGLSLSASTKTSVLLANPADLSSLTARTDSMTVNGRTFQRTFNAATRTVTEVTPEGRQSVAQLDTLGRLIKDHLAGLAPVRYGYGPRGFLTTVTQAGRTTRYDYDSTGRVKKVTDPLGRFTQYAYDSAGRVTTQTLLNGQQTVFAYDANGNLTSLTPPGRPAHTLGYTVDNLDSVYTPPAAGLPYVKTHFTFNLDRQLTQVLRPDSLTIGVNYDAAGRPSTITLPNGQMQATYNPTSDDVATLTAAGGGMLSYTRDGTLLTGIDWTGTVQGSVGFKYDNSFRVTKIAVNGADSIAFTYDRDDLLTSVGAMTLTRDPQNGRLTRTVLASDTSTWSYDDSTGGINRHTMKHAATTLFDAVYTRDSLERITQIVETVEGTTRTRAFTYDSAGRIDNVRVNGVLVSDYAYDAIGNRTSLTTQGGTVLGTYDDQDRMLTWGGASYGYSPNGELAMKLVGIDTTRYMYDVLGNLLQVRLPDGIVVDYLVDAENRRIGRKVNGTLVQQFLYETALAPVVEMNGAGQVVSRFVYGSRPNVPDYMVRSGATYRLILDHLGSVRLVVHTATGAVAQRIDYDEFGRVTLNTNAGFQPFGYAGGLLDDLTSLVRFGARDYQPDAGRWTTKDPLLFTGGDGSLYIYASGDPTNLSDPTGRSPACYIDMALNFAADKVSLRALRLLQKILPFVPGDINVIQYLEGEVDSPIAPGPIDVVGFIYRMGTIYSDARYNRMGGDGRLKIANDRYGRTGDADLGREVGQLDGWRRGRNAFKRAADIVGVFDLVNTFLTCRCKDLGYFK